MSPRQEHLCLNLIAGMIAFAFAWLSTPGEGFAQLLDQVQNPNSAEEGIALSLEEQVGAGRGDLTTPGSAIYLIKRDPARSIRRGRQLFQRKFTFDQGQGPRTASDGVGAVEDDRALGAGLADSCAACHGRPRGSAGFGGDVATRPDSRDAPHLFGLGLQEMLADEMTGDLRARRDQALTEARQRNRRVTARLISKGIDFGRITAHPDGNLDTRRLNGVDPDLRVKPFFAEGSSFSMRAFIVGAFKDEMGLETFDPCLQEASQGGLCITPAGLRLDGVADSIKASPVASDGEDGDGDGVTQEVDAALVDHMEFYLLNYFKPATGEQRREERVGFRIMDRIGCTGCHVQNLTVERDRRVADVETRHDPNRGTFNRLFATVSQLFRAEDDGAALPQLLPEEEPFLVRDIFTDFKRHDLGPAFYEIDYDGSLQTTFMTEPLWGVGSTAPYGHDGRSINLKEVILRHGGEAEQSRNAFAALGNYQQRTLLAALNSLVLFPPDDTASTLDEGDPNDPDFPQFGHGSIKLSELFQTAGPE